MTDILNEKEQTQADAAAPTGRKEITAERYLSRDILDQEWEQELLRQLRQVGAYLELIQSRCELVEGHFPLCD